MNLIKNLKPEIKIIALLLLVIFPIGMTIFHAANMILYPFTDNLWAIFQILFGNIAFLFSIAIALFSLICLQDFIISKSLQKGHKVFAFITMSLYPLFGILMTVLFLTLISYDKISNAQSDLSTVTVRAFVLLLSYSAIPFGIYAVLKLIRLFGYRKY